MNIYPEEMERNMWIMGGGGEREGEGRCGAWWCLEIVFLIVSIIRWFMAGIVLYGGMGDGVK